MPIINNSTTNSDSTTTLTSATTTEEKTTNKPTASTEETTIQSTTSTPEPPYQCFDVVVDHCDTFLHEIVEIFENVSINDCQLTINRHPLCTVRNCNSYIYHKDLNNPGNGTCTILSDTYEDYLSSCGIFGASLDTVENCLHNDTKYSDTCKVRYILFYFSDITLTFIFELF